MSFLKTLFKESGVKNVVTLFHAPSTASSVRALTIIKQHNANAVATATEDQASDHSTQPKTGQHEYDLEVREEAPTSDQLKSILGYIGAENAGKIVSGAMGVTDALKKVQQDGKAFQRPIVVDWNSGKAVIGDNESEILKLLKEATQEK
ncbi:DUF1687-domain-containing protein [Pseudovirgaria hyperparasitica]|uniref:DUF1687-domain-containing protein n=1 Tax=Pseudovirgaria hyperparasitica TaxID=470096 RepID=A0A6A6VW42_9PEZI|nr:DUF1687-domain-containing protein [Pseudovirgaria hyperparasitica]KAF2753467.1 DUF1687-domain-containing protein [Pseudovirgaria hyperparasitica]